jgi:hypothetical protein
MLTVEDLQENFSSPSTVSSNHGSPKSLSQPKNGIQEPINIGLIFVKSLLKILSENKQSPDYYSKIKKSQDFHFTILIQPAIPLLDYLRRILNFLKLDFSTLIIALIYIDRICREKVFLNEYNIHRIMVIAIYIAYTYNEDKTYDNNYLSLVSGMNKNEMVTLEEDFLELIEFKLFVDDELYNQYKDCIFKEYFNSKD